MMPEVQVAPQPGAHFVCPDCGQPCSCAPDSLARQTAHTPCGVKPADEWMVAHRLNGDAVIVFHEASITCRFCDRRPDA